MKLILLTLLLFSLVHNETYAQVSSRQKAERLWTSLTGVKPKASDLDKMSKEIEQGNAHIVARRIVSENTYFYNVVLRDFFAPWSSKDGSLKNPLDDMSLTAIGIVRDDLDFRRFFYDNIYYFADVDAKYYLHPGNPDPKLRNGNYDKIYLKDYDTVITSLANGENNHFKEIEDKLIPIIDKKYIKRKIQGSKMHKDPTAVAGVFSTRGFGKAYYTAGTNRAAVAYSMLHFMCSPIESLNDTSVPDFRVRRDVDREPGGVSETFKNFCVGCHSGMDALAGAFAHYDFDAGVVKYTSGKVVKKMNHNSVFPDGFISQSDSFLNLWHQGQNAKLGWDPSNLAGNGPRDFGRMIANSEGMAECMSKKVYEKVCDKEEYNDQDNENISKLKSKFLEDYNMKDLFVYSSVVCMGN